MHIPLVIIIIIIIIIIVIIIIIIIIIIIVIIILLLLDTISAIDHAAISEKNSRHDFKKKIICCLKSLVYQNFI